MRKPSSYDSINPSICGFCPVRLSRTVFIYCFFFNDPPSTKIYTLSLHDALPISVRQQVPHQRCRIFSRAASAKRFCTRSEEHTSELQSLAYLVCRLLLEKKNPSRPARRNACGSRVRTIQSTPRSAGSAPSV